MPFNPLSPSLRYRILGRLLLIKWLAPLILKVWRYARAYRSAFGPKPRMEFQYGSLPPKFTSVLVEAVVRVHEEKISADYTGLTEREKSLAQTMTWGTAGVAVVFLVAIATTACRPFPIAILISAGCFSFAVPLLVAFGLVFTYYTNPRREPLTVDEKTNLNLLVWSSQTLVAVGLGALLWSFNFLVFLTYFIALCLGWRALTNLGSKRLPPSAVKKVTEMLNPGAPTAEQSLGDHGDS